MSAVPRRVLVVEDDAAVRRLIATIVRRLGLEVDTAEDGIVAIERLQAGPYDLVVLDLMMPRMDGLSFLNELAEGNVRHDGPIVVMTAAADALVAKIDGTRVQAVMRKPFEVDQLSTLVQRTLAERYSDDPLLSFPPS